MRFTLLFFIVSLFQLQASETYSQNTKISINVKNVSLETVLDKIESLTNFKFIYKDRAVNYQKVVSINANEEALSSIFEKLFESTNLSYKIKGKLIVLKPKKNIITTEIKTEWISEIEVITGIVISKNGKPIPGVNIIEKGTKNATYTDFDGKFTLNVSNKKGTLIVSFLGFLTKEVLIDSKTNIKIILEENIAGLDEVVVVGYGSQSKVKITNSVSTLKSEELLSSPITSFEEGLAGQLAGVDVIQTSGDPGSSSSVNIRGVGTLTANINPLIVIDGFPSENFNLKSISPNDIESIDILKDAAAAAIYGSRGANGIILVTTKKGKKGTVNFTFNTSTGIQDVTKTIDTQNAYERARYVSQALKNSGKAPLAIYQPYLMGLSGLTDTNWQDEIFRSALMQEYNFTASGGSDQIGFFVSGSFLDQEGIVIGSDYNRINFRMNLNFNLSKKFKAGFYLAPSFSNRDKISDDAHKGNGIIITALMANPIYSPYNSDGSLNLSGDMIKSANVNGEAPVENPVALALLNSDKRTELGFLGGGFFEFTPINGLLFKTYLGGDYSSTTRDSFSPNTVGAYSIIAANKQATSFRSFGERKNYIIENTASYQKRFNDHNFKILIGQSYQTEDFKSTGSSTLLPQSTFANGILTSSYPLYEEKWSLISYLSRLNYDYKDKYILSGSIRRDGSSRFGENTKWGLFPSVSGAWRLGKEDFLKNKNIDELKLRASWGVTGNNGIPNYGSIPLLGSANYGDLGGLAPLTSPNENLSWEQTSTIDFGLDVSLFKNKLNFVVDYYKATTNDLLLNVPVPAHSGNSTSLRNIGKVENTGLEFAVELPKIKLGYVKWSSSFNISTNKNKVLELGPGQDRILTDYHITEIGKPLGSYYTYKKIGVFQTQEQINNAPVHPESRLGDYMFADINGDGKITSADKEISGDFFPDYTFGFTNTFKYKNISFSFSIQGKQGYEIFNGTGVFIRNLEGWSNGHSDINNYFSAENPNGSYATPGKHVKTYEQSDLMIEDGSYIRLRKVSLGYSFPDIFLNKLNIEKAKIYLSATNLFTISGYSGYNPEVSSSNSSFNSLTITPGFDYGAYPNSRTIVMGLNLSF